MKNKAIQGSVKQYVITSITERGHPNQLLLQKERYIIVKKKERKKLCTVHMISLKGVTPPYQKFKNGESLNLHF